MVFLAAFAVLAPQTPDTARIVVVATSDLHGQAVAWDFGRQAPAPGALARAATAIDSLRHRYPDQVVVVDAGDALEGTPFAAYYGGVEPQDPHPIVDAMNQVGYDAATVGNHDFDFGVPLLDRALSAATFPLSARISGSFPRTPWNSVPMWSCKGTASGWGSRVHHDRRHGLEPGPGAWPVAGDADRR
jgi:2',3'-cyclic-nucleotide 2'-phosphodiesterase/3'-nucleotidase